MQKNKTPVINEIKLIQYLVGFLMFHSELGGRLGLSESTDAGDVFEK